MAATRALQAARVVVSAVHCCWMVSPEGLSTAVRLVVKIWAVMSAEVSLVPSMGGQRCQRGRAVRKMSHW